MDKSKIRTILLFALLAVMLFAFAGAVPQGSIRDEVQEEYSSDTSTVDDDYAFLFD